MLSALIQLITLPGVVAHELAHLACCICTGTVVHRVCLFRFGNPAGYVVHGRPPSVWGQMLIGIGPFLLNSAGAFALGCLAWQGAWRGETQYLQGWLGIALGLHAFPSRADAREIWGAMWGRGVPLVSRLIGVPLAAFICLGASAAALWMDMVYGIAVAVVLPGLVAGG